MRCGVPRSEGSVTTDKLLATLSEHYGDHEFLFTRFDVPGYYHVLALIIDQVKTHIWFDESIYLTATIDHDTLAVRTLRSQLRLQVAHYFESIN